MILSRRVKRKAREAIQGKDANTDSCEHSGDLAAGGGKMDRIFNADFLGLWDMLVDSLFWESEKQVIRPCPDTYFHADKLPPFDTMEAVRRFISNSRSSLERIGEFVDREFYSLQVPRLDESGLTAAEHYFVFGWRLGLDPNEKFSSRAYLRENPDISMFDLCPLDHYNEYGRDEGRIGERNYSDRGLQDRDTAYDLIATAFDLDFYLSKYNVPIGIDPVRYYMTAGWRRLHDPSASFSTEFYYKRSPDVRAADEIPFFHYLLVGLPEGRAGTSDLSGAAANYSPLEVRVRAEFNADYYCATYPEVVEVHADPVKHFCETGWKKGYNPNRDFSTSFYLELSEDVARSGRNPFYHYLTDGRSRGRPAQPAAIELDELRSPGFSKSAAAAELLDRYFDPIFYRARYEDVERNKILPLQHYLDSGWLEHRDPAIWFSTRDYLKQFPDLSVLNINPLVHLVLWGDADAYASGSGGGGGGRRIRKVVGSTTVNEELALAKTADASRAGAVEPVERDLARPLRVGWVVPDFDAGGGGHMTIFRMVRWLEIFGHHCTIIVDRPVFERTNEQRRQLLLSHYQVVKADVVMADAELSYDFDCLIATGWQTAALVASAPGGAARFYFVQDYEPMFYPVGTQSLLSGQTYGLDLSCICASRWLKAKMEAHGRKAVSFDLAADEAYWKPEARPDNPVPRIAFYGRGYTSRRAVELGYMALEVLAERGVRFIADIFGAHEEPPQVPFDAIHHGVVDASRLRQIYQKADIGLCFSATNYSLVPQEMMATGLPVVELDTESTRVAFPEGVARLAEPNPHRIADAITALFEDPVERAAQGDRGHAWVSQLSWEKSARIVEAALLDRETDEAAAVGAAPRPEDMAAEPHVTVVIPTYNGGELLKTVAERVLSQRAPWAFELLVIDSSSDDGTWEWLQSLGGVVRAHRISKNEFHHGRTRNKAVEMARGRFVAFLTQDALPTDLFWLYNLVTMLELNPTAAGVFGRHIAYDHEPAFVKRDMDQHFRGFEKAPALVSKFTRFDAWLSGDVAWRRFLHFYSDNNSCLRKSVWARIPYPEVDYGEDQVWAARIIEAGYAKVYAHLAAVYHSHSYNKMQTFERARTESEFFRHEFGYMDIAVRDAKATIAMLNAEDLRWGRQNGVPEKEIHDRLALNTYSVTGHIAGGAHGVDIGSAF